MVAVNFLAIRNATPAHETLLKAAGVIIDSVLADWTEFEKAVNAADFSGGMLWRASTGRVEEKNKQFVIDVIKAGQERSTKGNDKIDMEIELKPHKKPVVGTARLGNQPISPAFWFVNRCVAKNDAISMARHLMHEWMHVAGFFHSSQGPNQDDVPYEIGDIVRNLAKKRSAAGLLPDMAFGTEDSLIAHELDEAEDEVDFEAGVTRTILGEGTWDPTEPDDD
jgi:hypothetical protein